MLSDGVNDQLPKKHMPPDCSTKLGFCGKEVERDCLFSRQTSVSATTRQFGKRVKERDTKAGKIIRKSGVG